MARLSEPSDTNSSFSFLLSFQSIFCKGSSLYYLLLFIDMDQTYIFQDVAGRGIVVNVGQINKREPSNIRYPER